MEDDYYKSSGGQIPVKWTAPEVYTSDVHDTMIVQTLFIDIGTLTVYQLPCSQTKLC